MRGDPPLRKVILQIKPGNDKESLPAAQALARVCRAVTIARRRVVGQCQRYFAKIRGTVLSCSSRAMARLSCGKAQVELVDCGVAGAAGFQLFQVAAGVGGVVADKADAEAGFQFRVVEAVNGTDALSGQRGNTGGAWLVAAGDQQVGIGQERPGSAERARQPLGQVQAHQVGIAVLHGCPACPVRWPVLGPGQDECRPAVWRLAGWPAASRCCRRAGSPVRRSWPVPVVRPAASRSSLNIVSCVVC